MAASAFAGSALTVWSSSRPADVTCRSRHAFIGRELRVRLSLRQSTVAYRRIACTNLLGLPRVFGGRRRSSPESELTKDGKDAKLQSIISVPPPERPSVFNDSVTWLRANPVRGVALVVFFGFLLRRIIRSIRGPSKSAQVVSDVATNWNSSNSTNGIRGKAVPLQHESTDEAMDLIENMARKYVIVGGKGGVGKTSMSAALATQFADRGQVTLIVSTDPAHSLSDAFDQSVSGGSPVPVVGIENLYAQEVNPDNIKQSFRLLSATGSGGQGMLAGLDDMGFDDLNSLFETLPPGFDEAVALTEIVKYIEGDPEYRKFQRIVFDTAPTGHTLRLLALPDFLNGFFGKILSMKSKFGGFMNQFKGMFGGGRDMGSDIDASMNDVEEMKRSMGVVRDLFRDKVQTEFIVATIPNMMAISESTRLIDELRKENIPVRHVFVNQLQPSNEECTFCSARHKEHSSNLHFIQNTFKGLRIATVQSFDREIRGAPALRAMGAQLFPSEYIPSSDAHNSATSSTGSDTGESSSVNSKPSSATVEVVE